MHRLFVAIRPPPAIRLLLLGLMGGVHGARWLEEEQLHLTLRFIGEVDRHRAKDLHAALGAVHHQRFEIAIENVRTFERKGAPATIWAGVTPHAPLDALHKKIDQACLRAGIEPDRRAFLPHITLARLGRGCGPVTPLLASAGGATSPPFPVDEFRLYESLLAPEGPLYEVAERYPLDRPATSGAD